MKRKSVVDLTRRECLLALAGLPVSAFAAASPEEFSPDPWRKAAAIREALVVPRFPARMFPITEYGAVEGDQQACSRALAEAIGACHQAGGGRVLVPAGTWPTGPVHLLSGVELHLEQGAALLFSQNPSDYLPLVRTWFEGMELMNYSPFVYACEAENVAITGNGVLDGQADFGHWWPWRGPRAWTGAKSGTSTGWVDGMPYQKDGRDRLIAMVEERVPAADRQFGEGYYLRSAMIEFNRCRHVLVDGPTIRHAPFWSVHPVLSRHVTVRNISIENPVGSNADGVDPEACDHVLIENCRFDTGDDCISLKSGRNQEGRRLATPCQNVVISGCEFSSERSALSCGSESSGGIRQVFIDNVTAGRIFRLFRIKTNSQRGGVNEHIYLRGATVEAALENLVEIQTNFSEPLKDGPAGSAPAPHFPVVRDISFENIETGPVYRAFNLAGSTETPIQRLMLRNIRIETVQNPDRVAHVPDPTVERVTVGGRAITLA